MQRQVDGGGITTIDQNTLHTAWPCYPHREGETCDEAKARVHKVLRPSNGNSRIFVPGRKRDETE